MTYLTLVLSLVSGQPERITMPAWECHAASATMHQAWSVGGRVDRDDGAVVINAKCETPTMVDLISMPSEGICDMEDMT